MNIHIQTEADEITSAQVDGTKITNVVAVNLTHDETGRLVFTVAFADPPDDDDSPINGRSEYL